MRRSTLWYKNGRPKPTKPEPPIASQITTTSMSIGGAPMPSATRYVYERSKSSPGAWSTVSDSINTSFEQTGLEAATVYVFRRRYYIGDSVSPWSDNLQTETLGSSVLPGTPTEPPTAVATTTTTISLNWNTVSDASTYSLQRSLSAGSGYSTIVTQSGTSYVDTVSEATTYYYKYFGNNSDGSGQASGYVQITTGSTQSPPATPTNAPTSSSKTSTSVTVGLTAVATADDYIIQRSPNGSTSWTGIYTGPLTSFADTGLTASTTYYYRYSARNEAGQSGWSPTLTVTTNASNVSPNIQPVSGFYIRNRSGSCTHPNFNTSGNVYQEANAEEIVASVAAAGFGFIRGMFTSNTASTWATHLRTYKVKWLMTIVPEATTNTTSVITNQTIQETKNKIIDIKTNYSDIVAGLEGPNEPNHNRNGTTVPSNWAQQAVNHQQAMWDTAKANMSNGSASTIKNVPIVGPSLHDIAVENSNGQDWEELHTLGITNYQDMCGLHTYPGGSFPTRKLDVGLSGKKGRLEYIYDTFGANYPVWCTEWGYHNAFGFRNHPPVTRKVAGKYAVRGYLQFITTLFGTGDGLTGAPRKRGLYMTYYEHLDDPESSQVFYTSGDAPTTAHIGELKNGSNESNFGLLRAGSTNPTTWTSKAAYTDLSTFLNAIKDPASVTADYVPVKVKCDVVPKTTGSKLQWQVTATKAQSNAGVATLWIWRDMEIWDRATSTYAGAEITVPTVKVDVTDAQGTRTLDVNGYVQRLDLRA